MPGQFGAGGVFVRQEGQDFADRAFSATGLGQGLVCLDLVAVAAPVLLLDDVAALDQVADDAVGAALGDAHVDRYVAQADAWVAGDTQHHLGVVGQETPAPHLT